MKGVSCVKTLSIILYVVGIILAILGILMNSNDAFRLISFLAGEGDTPGTPLIIIGVILIVIATVLLVLSKKKKTTKEEEK